MILPLACGGGPAAHTIDVRNFTFVPANAEAVVGDTLLFANHDVVPHTATARDKSWDTGEILPGDTVRVLATSAGEYFCVYHPTMIATVVFR